MCFQADDNEPTEPNFFDKLSDFFDSAEKIVEAGEKVDNAYAIKRQYVLDIMSRENNTRLTETPDANVFPDIDEYNELCENMYDKLYGNEGYSLYTDGDVDVLVETMGSWDLMTSIRIGWVTSSYVVSDLIDAAEEIF